MSYALVLDVFWYSSRDPVKVSAIAATCAEIDAMPFIDPLVSPGSWNHNNLHPIHQKTVMNQQTGQPLSAHVCLIS